MSSRHPLAMLAWIVVDSTLGVFSTALLVVLPAVSVGIVVGPIVGFSLGALGLVAYYVLSESVFPATYRVAERRSVPDDDTPDELFHLSVSPGAPSESSGD